MSENWDKSTMKGRRAYLRALVKDVSAAYCPEDVPNQIQKITELAPEMLDALDEAEILAAQFENSAAQLDKECKVDSGNKGSDLHIAAVSAGEASGLRIAASYIRERVLGESSPDLEDCPSCGAGACAVPGEVCAECKREGVKK